MKHALRIITILGTLMLASTVSMRAQVDSESQGSKYDADNVADRQQQMQVQAMSKRQQKKLRIDTRKTETYTTPVYMFSFSNQFGDSTVYVTGVQEVENAQLTRRYDYLSFRSDYSYQFTRFLGETFGASNQTTSIFYNKDKKKLVKRFLKVMKRYESNPEFKIVMITADKFHFKAVEDYTNLGM